MQPIVKPLSYSHRNYLFIFLTLVFLVSLPIFIFYAIGYRYNLVENTPVITATGGLYVSSEIEDSTIYIDESEVTDNLRIFRRASYLQGIEPGLHRIHVQAPGFDTWVKELVISPQIVTEVEAFNIPIVPQLRPVSQYTDNNEMVYFDLASSSNPYAHASTAQPFIVATSSATSSKNYNLNQEFVLLERLFNEKASTTAIIKALEEQEDLPNFNFSSNSPNLSRVEVTKATSTIVRDKMMLYKNGEDIFVKTLAKDIKNMPYYFCTVELSEAIKSRMDIMDLVNIKEEDFVSTTTTLREGGETVRVCRDKIKLDRKNKEVLDFAFFPDNINLVLMRFADGIYVTEIDDRSWQNTQLLYRGGNLQMLVYGDSIFIKDGKFIFEALTELVDE